MLLPGPMEAEESWIEPFRTSLRVAPTTHRHGRSGGVLRYSSALFFSSSAHPDAGTCVRAVEPQRTGIAGKNDGEAVVLTRLASAPSW